MPVEMVDLASPEVVANPYPTYARLRRVSPVAMMKRPAFGTAWLLSRHVDVTAAFHDPRLVSDRVNVGDGGDHLLARVAPPVLRMMRNNMVARDGAAHRRLRTLVQSAFTPGRVERLTTTIEAIVTDHLERGEDDGGFDLVRDVAFPATLRVISLLLGVPEHQRDDFDGWATRFLDEGTMSTLGLVSLIPGAGKMKAFLDRLIALRRAEPGEDLISGLVAAEAQGDRLDTEELVATVFLLLIAGHESTANFLSSSVLALLDHPDALQRLREAPGQLDPAIEELLRYTSPVAQGAPRYAAEDIVLHGERIPRGAAVVTLLGSANWDDAVFPDPHRLDLDREVKRHVGFGLGVHYCLGAALARLEGRVLLRTLIDRYPELEIVVPRDRLRWRSSVLLRGLQSLPVHLGPRSGR